MIKSSISTSHHYYVLFFDSLQLKSVDTIFNLFEGKKDGSYLFENRKNNIFHFQLLLNRQYGSNVILGDNRVASKNGEIFYWYDFYLGQINYSNKKINYICYPYNELTKYLQDILLEKTSKIKFYKPILDKTLVYMRNRNERNKSEIERQGFDFDIIKYSAEVKEEINAKRVNIVGDDPLNSKIYDILEREAKDQVITIKPVSLKLKCKKLEVGELEVSFDRLGKHRFWLKRNCQEQALPMLSYVYNFFADIDAVESSGFISSLTLLDNNE